MLMNIGPTPDGRIDPIFQERLQQMGDWLKVNGEAIYATKPWRVQNDTVTPDIWYTSKAGAVYAISLEWPAKGVLNLSAPKPSASTKVTLLGLPSLKLNWKSGKNGIMIMIPNLNIAELPCQWAWVFKMTGVM
ncbi:PREDICTED: alpha-L-fucosidase-like [Acropora digitifera]|nr:PREDICTED: alpha-L-fucosidase-like [Acropora digitifera]